MMDPLSWRDAGLDQSRIQRRFSGLWHALRMAQERAIGGVVRLPGGARRKAALAVTGLAVAAAGSGAASVLFRYDPAHFGFYPRCLLFSLTGLYCPGCGALRASHQLLHGNLLGALDYNPLFLVAAPFLAYAFLSKALEYTTGTGLPTRRLSGRATWAVAVLVIGFGIIRNLPYAPFAVLAP